MFSNSFPEKSVMGDLLGSMLWEIGAVHFRPEEPYKLASGLASPVYIDGRKLLSYPRIRSAVIDFACATLLSEVGFEQFDVIAGGETAGIPFAALLADRLALPMIYVRKKPKGHGRNAQIEGHMPEGARVLVIEDLTTAGVSMFTFIDAIRAAGGRWTMPWRCSSTASFRKPSSALPTTRSRSTTLPPGATCWPSPAARRCSTMPRSPRSKNSSTPRWPGLKPMAAHHPCRRADKPRSKTRTPQAAAKNGGSHDPVLR